MADHNLKVISQGLTEEDRKRIIKEAISEWLDARFAAFGRWSLLGVAAAVLALIAYFLLIKAGWTPPV